MEIDDYSEEGKCDIIFGVILLAAGVPHDDLFYELLLN